MKRSTITTITKTKSDTSKQQQQQQPRPKKILPTINSDSVDSYTLPKVCAEFVSPTWSKILSEELKSCALHNEHENYFSSSLPKTPRVLPERYEREGKVTSRQSSYYRTNSSNEKSGCPTPNINERSTSATNYLVNRYKETKNNITDKLLKASTKELPKTNEKNENALSEYSSSCQDNSINDCMPWETDITKYNPKYNPDNERITKYDSEIAAVFYQEEEDDFSDNGFDLSTEFHHKDKNSGRLSSTSIDVSNQHNDNSGNQNNTNNNNINNNGTNNANKNVNNNNHNTNRLDVKNNKFLHLTDIVRSMSKSPSGKPVGSNPI